MKFLVLLSPGNFLNAIINQQPLKMVYHEFRSSIGSKPLIDFRRCCKLLAQMVSTFIDRKDSTGKWPLPNPLVQGKGPHNALMPTVNMDQFVSQYSESSSSWPSRISKRSHNALRP